MKNSFYTGILLLISTLFYAQNNPSQWIGVDHKRGTELLVLKLAVSCNGEYTTSVGGVVQAEANLLAWLALINEMYGRQYCVRFELIPNNNLLIFDNAATDPWTTLPPGSGGCTNAFLILNDQATVIDSIIGAANYDISHVVVGPPFGGGCAGGYKSGMSGQFDIPVTRHEMGHQFSQPHTISNGGNNNFELEGGNWSVQGGNNHPHAHATSYHSLVNHINTTAAGIGTNTATGNTIPTVDAGPDVSIPIGTPFTLTGSANDPNAGDELDYIWDTMDGGIGQALPPTDETQGSLFMRLLPSNKITRTIPDLADIINNQSSTANAHLSGSPRDMNVKLTVNDNHRIMFGGELIAASGINNDDKKITIVDNGGPFSVTSPNTAITYSGGSSQNITWNVNGTDLAPISTSNVKISLSTNGGLNFPIVLANSTPNDGSHSVTLPNINTTAARVKIEAVGNIYFDMSNADFTINQNLALAGINIAITGVKTIVSEPGQTDIYNISLITTPTGPVQVTLSTDIQSEISTDGINFTNVQIVEFTNTTPQLITVRGRYDSVTEGPHTSIIQHIVSETSDNSNYPKNSIGEPIVVHVSDAQIAPVIGIDFDETGSTNTPVNWVKITDMRTGVANELSLDDGTPTSIDVTTTATLCGTGGCGFNSGNNVFPGHVQDLTAIQGVSYAKGTVVITFSSLLANTGYNVFLFGLGVFGEMDQNVTISGSGPPVAFLQNALAGTMFINDQASSNANLNDFGKQITSSGTGTVTITVTSNKGNDEMSFNGVAIQQVSEPPAGHCPPNYNLSTAQTITQSYETDGTIASSQAISGNQVIVSYDSNSSISLNMGFEVAMGTIFNAYIDGCEGTQ